MQAKKQKKLTSSEGHFNAFRKSCGKEQPFFTQTEVAKLMGFDLLSQVGDSINLLCRIGWLQKVRLDMVVEYNGEKRKVGKRPFIVNPNFAFDE